VLCHDFVQFDEFLDIRSRSRIVFKPGGHSPRTGAKSFAKQAFHLFHFFRGGFRIGPFGLCSAHHLEPQIALWDKVNNIRSERHPVYFIEPLGNIGLNRKAGAAVAGHNSGHALSDIVQVGLYRSRNG